MRNFMQNHIGKLIIILVVLIVILTPIFGALIISGGHPYSLLIINKQVKEHLKGFGYTKEDIAEAHYIQDNDLDDRLFYEGLYMVKYNDEPNVMYYYAVTKDTKTVKQMIEKEEILVNGEIKITKANRKHTEANCIEGNYF